MSEKEYTRIEHGFGPFVQPDSRILILGSFPSVRSREQQFFYGHPQNRFWPLLAALLDEEVPELNDIEAKKRILSKHHIALYDSIESCEIIGSSDAHIRNVVPADIPGLLQGTAVSLICCNGAVSYKYYRKFHAQLPVKVVRLPSTSPANAAWSLKKLREAWSVVSSEEKGV